MKRARKPKLPPSLKPWPCAILAVDTAATSGWSSWCLGELTGSGEVKATDYIELSHTCRGVLERMGEVVLVLEKPWKGNNARAYVGLGGARMMWLSAWENAGGSKRRIVSVYPQTWRSKVLPRGWQAIGAPSCEWAIATRTQVHRSHMELGPDECAAICIGLWACHAGEVGKVLPKRIREAA